MQGKLYEKHRLLSILFFFVYEINNSIFKFSALGLLQEFYNSLKQLGDIHLELSTTQNGCHLVVLMNCKIPEEGQGPKI